MKLVFATNNRHKLKEISRLTPKRLTLLTLKDIGFTAEIAEDFLTLDENASAKADLIYRYCKIPTFADDTGLEVDILNGKPGVHSARFAGPACNDSDNVRKLLSLMENVENRAARFRTVIALRWAEDREMLFEGAVRGRIALHPEGKKGFGYDPVFIPQGFDRSFAQMPLRLKNTISHRAVAYQKLSEYLESHFL